MNEFMSAIGGYTHIVINRCHGGFSLSHDARVAYLTSLKIDFSITARESRDSTSRHGPRIIVNGEQWFDHAIRRDDPYLVQVIRDLGDKANGVNARLKIVSIPSEVVWDLHDYDGIEWIAETHRVWN